MRFVSVFTHKPTNAPPSPQLMADMGKLIEAGMKEGWLITTEGVQAGEIGMIVRQTGGEVTVVDGPFSEAKEVIGGYAVIEAKSKQEMIELTRRFLAVAGDGTCEIHQLFEMPAGNHG